MKSILIMLVGVSLLIMLPGTAGSSDASGQQFRLIGSGPASVSAIAQSPVYAVYVVGGAGQAVGISASPGFTSVAGGTSNQLPTARIFRNGLESE